jgi:hypothetical protein
VRPFGGSRRAMIHGNHPANPTVNLPCRDVFDETFQQSRLTVSAKTAAARHSSSSIDGVMSRDD